ncbi:hypothetical protein [Massilia sp. 9I]|uniref:hypothetical protein n=1 Tax=Massilia sp. 9I TaxID=2653152 RepID=UPI0012EF3860|nr:hypothetical protein [Massilia sp. 9I]VXC68188.1 conserved exported hypothetical protein [Massilia sp. 9I]
MKLSFPFLLAALLVLPAASVAAQQTLVTAAKDVPKVNIHRKTNPGDLPYRSFFGMQNYVTKLLPTGRRVIDLRLRVNFATDKSPAYDQFDPKSWAVAIVGESTDQVVPTSRGGYFLLPELPDAAHENATIMFNTPTREGRIAVEWKVRVGASQTLSWAEFAQALDEARAVQRKIPWDRSGMRELRLVEYDGLRACFRSGEGRIEVGGQEVATSFDGGCRVLKFDPASVAPGDIRFVGPLDIVTLSRNSVL